MKQVLITGANGNLGTAAVKKFLDAGYRVIAVARSGSALGFASGNKYFELHQVDLSKTDEVADFAEKAIHLYGSIEAALFLAGGFEAGDIHHTSETGVQEMITKNFGTAYTLSNLFFRHMMDYNYGRLVFIGAKAGLEGSFSKNAIAYGLSKSLLFHYAEILNAAAKGKNVTASVVVPSIIDTEPNREAMPDADHSKWVKPEAIADLLEYICSNRSDALREPVYKIYGED
ncbi:MAG: SDR family NAD(P)-dependent oxidoreductase [Chitinophagaceae bacterium]|nr:SDR family NAD(P)-dependent oxidoreductase [Chitinophagaceae bacterium]MCW5929664.1 SDR family NAD(P)-dependent oxidoreductase [Chitinophagaceae bacterium]